MLSDCPELFKSKILVVAGDGPNWDEMGIEPKERTYRYEDIIVDLSKVAYACKATFVNNETGVKVAFVGGSSVSIACDYEEYLDAWHLYKETLSVEIITLKGEDYG